MFICFRYQNGDNCGLWKYKEFIRRIKVMTVQVISISFIEY